MKTKEINRIIGVYTEHAATPNLKQSTQKAMAYIIKLLNKELKARQENKAAKKNIKLVDLKPISGFFGELQGWLDDITVKPCDEKFNPGAKCNEEKGNGKDFRESIEKARKEFEAADRDKEIIKKLEELLNDALSKKKQLSGVIEEQRETIDKIIKENSAFVEKVCELTETISKLEKYNDSLTDIANAKDKELLSNCEHIGDLNKQIAEQAVTIARLTNEINKGNMVA